MGFIGKLFGRRNRSYDYQPRFYKSDKDGHPFKMEYKFDQFRSTVGAQGGLKSKVRRAMVEAKREGDRNLRIRLLVITSILVLIFLYIIDFDIAIIFGG